MLIILKAGKPIRELKDCSEFSKVRNLNMIMNLKKHSPT